MTQSCVSHRRDSHDSQSRLVLTEDSSVRLKGEGREGEVITACRISLLHRGRFVLRDEVRTRKIESLSLEIKRHVVEYRQAERREGVASQKLIKWFDSCEDTVDIIQAVQMQMSSHFTDTLMTPHYCQDG